MITMERKEIACTEHGEMFAWIIDRLGWSGFIELCKEFGGMRVYIPKKPYTVDRNREIKKQFDSILRNAYNPSMASIYAGIARQFGICERQVKKILTE